MSERKFLKAEKDTQWTSAWQNATQLNTIAQHTSNISHKESRGQEREGEKRANDTK